MRRSFDTIAPCYPLLEQLFFGDDLERMRAASLPFARHAQQALLIGDGDGRFAQSLLRLNSNARVTSIDASAGMLRRGRRRLANHFERMEWIQADALDAPYFDSSYDFIALHFLLDCLEQKQSDALLERLGRALRPGGVMAVSDFRINSPCQGAAIRLLYFAFGCLTDIRARELPMVRMPHGLVRARSESLRSRMIFCEVWKKPIG